MPRLHPGAQGSRHRSRTLVAVALGAALWAPELGSQTAESSDPPTPPPAPSAASGALEGESQSSDATSKDAESTKVRGWLVLSTDAPATVLVAGKAVGTLEPGDSKRHGIETTSAEVVATSVDVPSAIWRETVSLVAKAGKRDGDEDDSDGEDEDEDEDTDLDSETSDAGAAEVSLRRSVKVRIQMLAAIEDVRKVERRDKVWPHYETGLMWPKADNLADVTWRKAAGYCSELRLGGWDDWRLPRIDELATLQAMWSQAAFKTMGPVTLSACCPWSSSELDADRAWNYNFRFRRRFEGQKGYSYDLRALCVRTLTAEEISAHERELADAKRRKKEAKKKRKADEDAAAAEAGEPIADDGDR